MSPDTSRVAHRADPLLALLVAALGLSAIETSYAWAERWFHGPLTFALSAGLTLGLALAVGGVASVLRLASGPALALWIALSLGLSWGWPYGAVALIVVGLGLWQRPARAFPPALLGSCAALALAAAYLKSTNFAEHLGHKGDPTLEAIGGSLVLAFSIGGLPWLVAFVRPRVDAVMLTAALLALGCLLSLRPRLERGDGQHRQPPPGYASSSPRVGDASRPSVFLLVLDTVRADHLSVYGYARETMPALEERLRQRGNGAVFPHAYSNGTWTVPSHASLFTGQVPSVHGAHFALNGSVRVGFGIGEHLPTLAEALEEGGYATLAGYANHWLRSVKGMGRGFERYLRAPDKDELPFVGEALRKRLFPGLLWEATKGCARADDVNETLLSMVEPWSKGPNPLFVFANYVDAHGPYAPPAPFRGTFAPTDYQELSEHLSASQDEARRAQLMARYDEEILYLDHELDRFLDELERLDLLRDSWVFITADHGEAFGEHGVLEHGTTVHGEVTHVPLIVLPPEGVTLPVSDDPVSLVDVAATVAAIGGVELKGPGRDLRSASGAGLHATVLEFYGDPVKASSLGALAKRSARSVVVGRHKLIAYSDAFHLYDIVDDPAELVDLAGALPNEVERLKQWLPEFGEPTFRSDSEAPTPEALDHLKGMGYLGQFKDPSN